MDNGKDDTSAANNMSRLINQHLTKGEDYTDQGQLYYEERYRERVVRSLSKKANELGMLLVPSPKPA